MAQPEASSTSNAPKTEPASKTDSEPASKTISEPASKTKPASKPAAFPPEASSTGKRYYSLQPAHGHGPLVVCGADLCKRYIGSWLAKGKAPKGFPDLKEAVEYSAQEHVTDAVTVTWAEPPSPAVNF